MRIFLQPYPMLAVVLSRESLDLWRRFQGAPFDCKAKNAPQDGEISVAGACRESLCLTEIKAAKGGARVVELWDASHAVFLSSPDEVLQGMREFIKDLR